MKILWVKANKLLPVSSGGDIRSYHLARQLAINHELVFLSYYEGLEDSGYGLELQRHFPGAVAICTGKASASTAARALHYMGRAFDTAPYAVSRFASPAVRQFVATAFQQGKFDVAVADFLDAAINFPELSLPTVLFQHNVESEIWRRHAQTESNPLKRAIYQREFQKMLRYEQKAARAFPQVIAVSEHDAGIMSAWTDPSRIRVVPTGVDLQKFRPRVGYDPAPLVVFVGAMDWDPNIDAVEYFCQHIWPAVHAKVPQARFRVVGRNPQPRVQRLKSATIEVTGSVPSVLEHLHEAAVVVVPLRIGGGTRIKIYEAMAAGKAVVSTSVGAEGLDVQNGKDVILADDADGFGNAVYALLTTPELRRQYERAAVESAAQHDWSVVARKFAQVLEDVVDAGRIPALAV